MSRKRTAAFTAAAFILFTVSCAYQKIRDTSIETVVSKYPRAQILGVQTAQNEYFDFAKTPGRLRGTEVTGEAWHRVEFDPADVTTSKTDKDGRPVQVKTKDGKELKVLESSDGKLVCSVYGPVTIPVSEVRLAHIRTINTGLAIVGGVVAAGAIAGLIVAASKPRHPAPSPDSCPYIYSFDGAEYVFDAEPYGAAVCEGLTRTEWASLDHLAPVGGRYKVLVANELEETQYTDELKLIAVDHPLGTAAVPDTTGRFHTIARPLPPIGARDGKGRDILPLVDRNDKLFWVSTVEGREPGAEDDLRDELVFEFPKPAGATRVKLMANAWTTMWGSMVAKKFLEVRGRSLPDWYAEVNSHGRGLNCHILTNGVRILEDRDGGFLAGLIRAGLDKVFVHIDSGQRHVHGDVEAARRAAFDRLEAAGMPFALSVTISGPDERALPALARKYARYRHFDGILAVLGRDPLPPSVQDAQLVDEYAALADDLGIEPSSYVPSNVSDGEISWLVYTYFVNPGTGRAFGLSPLFDRLFRTGYKLATGRRLFSVPSRPRLYEAGSWVTCFLDAALHPRKWGEFRRFAAGASPLGAGRLQFIAIQTPPEFDKDLGRLRFCYNCPDATIRNGLLTPVCIADHINPLAPAPGLPARKPVREDWRGPVYAELGEFGS